MPTGSGRLVNGQTCSERQHVASAGACRCQSGHRNRCWPGSLSSRSMGGPSYACGSASLTSAVTRARIGWTYLRRPVVVGDAVSTRGSVRTSAARRHFTASRLSSALALPAQVAKRLVHVVSSYALARVPCRVVISAPAARATPPCADGADLSSPQSNPRGWTTVRSRSDLCAGETPSAFADSRQRCRSLRGGRESARAQRTLYPWPACVTGAAMPATTMAATRARSTCLHPVSASPPTALSARCARSTLPWTTVVA